MLPKPSAYGARNPIKEQEAIMTTILQINSAARSQGAQSTLLADELTAKLQQSNAGAKLVVRNLLPTTCRISTTPRSARSSRPPTRTRRANGHPREERSADRRIASS